MPDFTLYQTHALGGRAPLAERLPGGLMLAEIAGRSLVSLAPRRGREVEVAAAVSGGFGMELPEPGRFGAGDRASFVWMGPQQWFADAAEVDLPDLQAELARVVGEAASLTDQSDSWVRLRLSGAGTGHVLERLVMLDLNPARFPAGAAARTVAEHLSTVILCHEPGSAYELWSPRSSARSFAASIRHAAGAAVLSRMPEERS